jgi:hypothetical protein
MERDNFISVKGDGTLWFYEIQIDDIEPLSPELHALFANPDEWRPNGWGYLQGREMVLAKGGLDWFDEIRKPVEDQPVIAGPST